MNISRLAAISCATIAFASLSSGVYAQTWTETGDAGETLNDYQITSGSGSITTITGSIATDMDADVYRIHLDGGVFTATTVGNGTTLDTILALFTLDGDKLVDNDDASSGVSQSTITYTPLAAGDYLIGISSYNNAPFSADVFNPNFYDGQGGQSSGDYKITLGGASFSDNTTPLVPEPGTLETTAIICTGLGMGLLVGRRKNR